MRHPLSLDDIALGDIAIGDAQKVVFEALTKLDRTSAQRIYAALRDWLWKTVNARRRDEELSEWYDLMRRAAARLSTEHKDLSERITALYELLYESVAVSEALPIESVVKRKHVQGVLNILAVAHRGALDRVQLQTILGLNQANLSRIISMMEASGLVERTISGKHVRVALTRTGAAFAETNVASETSLSVSYTERAEFIPTIHERVRRSLNTSRGVAVYHSHVDSDTIVSLDRRGNEVMRGFLAFEKQDGDTSRELFHPAVRRATIHG
jgi:predicted transcriptional regulator